MFFISFQQGKMFSCKLSAVNFFFCVLFLISVFFPAYAASPLPSLNVDRSQISVSGLSSGAFMANQLGYAFSGTFMGVGILAGGPYMCAGHQPYSACIYNAAIDDKMLAIMQGDLSRWSGTLNDSLANVARQKIWIFVGNIDTHVGQNPVRALRNQYQQNGVTSLSWVLLPETEHVFPADFDSAGNTSCNIAAPPFIANCHFDAAGGLLTWLYGSLNPRNNAPPDRNYIEFDQTPYIGNNQGMASTGWIYIPDSCAQGNKCRLHVALHGCLQNYETIGDKFIKNTGYTRWADTNRIIILFPQTRIDTIPHQTTASGFLPNSNGCWDWIGWYGNNFAQKQGSEVAAIMKMVRHIEGSPEASIL